MALFKSDLFRNFSFGFVAGTAIVAIQIAPAIA